MLILSQNGGLKTDFAVICRGSRQGQRERSASSTAWCRRCENENRFRIRQRRGASRGYPLPACVSTAPSGNRKGGGNAAGHTQNTLYSGPSMLSCASDFDRKKRCKKVIRITFCPSECLPSETKKAVMRPPSRCQSVVKGSVRRYRRQCQMKLRTCRSGQPRRRGQSESCFHSGPSARRRQCSILTGDAR